MSQVEARLLLDVAVVARGERYAAERGETLAEVVAELLAKLPLSEEASREAAAAAAAAAGEDLSQLPPAVRRLREIAYQAGPNPGGDGPVDWKRLAAELRANDYERGTR